LLVVERYVIESPSQVIQAEEHVRQLANMVHDSAKIDRTVEKVYYHRTFRL
jgi:hypothetical protein